MKIFSGTANESLAKGIAKYLSISLGKLEIYKFSDCELNVALGIIPSGKLNQEDTRRLQEIFSDLGINNFLNLTTQSDFFFPFLIATYNINLNHDRFEC